ncbi:hypothetical protein E4U09_006022 [Claviceps aff. purpurea]|uniref:Uncharacterized protein n=1 Tax=Claviceps aff. purpurea TaxID=1967640 RepID=A0A9P7U1A1_9HYPO|nr:hypothetical protein E4U09_006022 [Claviceps aff. purpurea]
MYLTEYTISKTKNAPSESNASVESAPFYQLREREGSSRQPLPNPGSEAPSVAPAWLLLYVLFTVRPDTESLRLELVGTKAAIIGAQLRDVVLAIDHPLPTPRQQQSKSAFHPIRSAKPAPGAVVYSCWIPHLRETFSMVALDYINDEHLMHYLFLDDPRTMDVVGEPKGTNSTVIMYDLMHGFGVEHHVDLPNKRGVFVRCPRGRERQGCGGFANRAGAEAVDVVCAIFSFHECDGTP